MPNTKHAPSELTGDMTSADAGLAALIDHGGLDPIAVSKDEYTKLRD